MCYHASPHPRPSTLSCQGGRQSQLCQGGWRSQLARRTVAGVSRCSLGGISLLSLSQEVVENNYVTHPRKALRGGISKVNRHQVCQFLTTISHKIAPRTSTRVHRIPPLRAFCGWALRTLGLSGYEVNSQGPVLQYRGPSLIRNTPPPEDHHRALGIVLL